MTASDQVMAGFAACVAAAFATPAPFEYHLLPPEEPRRERDRSARRKPKARRQR